jgi:hypothetical protein
LSGAKDQHARFVRRETRFPPFRSMFARLTAT